MIENNYMKDIKRNLNISTSFNKMHKESCSKQDFYLSYAKHLSENGELKASLDVLYSMVKLFSNCVKSDQIVPIVNKLIDYVKVSCEQHNFSQLRNVFSCCKCNGVLYEPITIACGHTYCKSCYRKGFSSCKVCNYRKGSYEFPKPCCNVVISSLVNKLWSEEVKGVETKSFGNKMLKDCHQAIDMYTQAAVYAPRDHAVLSNRSHAFHLLGDVRSALADAQLSISYRPDWAKGYYRKAVALVSLGELDEALVCLLQCAALEDTQDLGNLKDEISKVLVLLLNDSARRSISSCNENDEDWSTSAIETNCINDEEKNRTYFHDNINGFNSSKYSTILSNSPIQYIEECSLTRSVLNDFSVEMAKIIENDMIYNRTPDSSRVSLSDFECTLCYHCFWQPVTTPCGHSFCRSCLDRCLDHSVLCPLCKSSLSEYLAERRANTTEFLEEALKSLFLDEYQDRKLTYEQEISEYGKSSDHLNVHIPIFVATAALPTVSCLLHVFEPRYRLMIRRCMESGARQFGMCMPDMTSNGFSEYGTMLEIIKIEYTPDGRSIVHTVGLKRFLCLSKETKDGYNTAMVQFLKDDKVCTLDEIEELSKLHDSVYEASCRWFEAILPEKKSRIEYHYGPMPSIETHYWRTSDGPSWLWWIIAILPLEHQSRINLVMDSSLRNRFKIVSKILRCLASQ